MARTLKGEQLTEEHRQQQVTIAGQVAEAIRRLFRRTVDWEDIDQSAEVFAREAAPVVAQYRLASRLRSIDYVEAFRAAEAIGRDVEGVEYPEDGLDVADIAAELLRSTRGAMKSVAKKGYGASDGMDRGEMAATGRAEKIAGDGGRSVVEAEVRQGRQAVGYARVADADPCPFCAMLASRGVYRMGQEAEGAGLYHRGSFIASNARFAGDGEFKVHDGCCCTLEPVYRVDGKLRLPGNGDELAREWAQVAAGQPDPWLAWQRWRQSGTLPENYDGPLDSKPRRAPVRGQATGVKKRPVPQKPSERARKRGVGARADWTSQDYLDHAEELAVRANRVQEELAALLEAGQTGFDAPVVHLEEEHKALLSRIARYRKKARTM
ncbi:hypothetical protein [Corynebacterium heidelbergense]|uniref:MuF-like minor capsid protein n=1 Tax=Corynebacterium heidelbergense TaxID=2055947 RepID=A0A364VC72_9CORY|nr:hypothetical protein [Corynebacterium heidelbergense]RAV34249.1 hypothetical protein CWC39_04150 [Corynebacterium heidelbergense]WCZ36979.1 hypothetical protein CHEID_07230 [Corynebacterium heidelbergense]